MKVRPSVAIALILAFVVFVYVGIPAMGAVFEDDERVIDQTEGEEYTVTADVITNATSVDDVGGTVDYTLEDENTTQTVTLNEGETATVSMSDGEIDVTADNVSGDVATTTYTYDNTYGMSDAAASLVAVIVMFFILGVAVLVAAPVMDSL